jgi:hypothetical protein
MPATMRATVMLATLVSLNACKSHEPTGCAKLLGPLDGIEAVTRFPLRADRSGGELHYCSYYVWKKTGTSNPIVVVEDSHAVNFPNFVRELEGQKFASHSQSSSAPRRCCSSLATRRTRPRTR